MRKKIFFRFFIVGFILLSACTGKYNLEQMAGEQNHDVIVNPEPGPKLKSILLSSGTLSSPFSPSNFSYYSSVSQSVSTIKITPTAEDATSVIRVNGEIVQSGSASLDIPLEIGSNTVFINVSTKDIQLTNTYIITVTRLSGASTLDSISKTGGALSPVFSSSNLYYSTSESYNTSSITFTPTATNSNSTIQISNTTTGQNLTAIASGATSSLVNLNLGANNICLVVTSQDGKSTNTYSIYVWRNYGNANLSSLTLSSGNLTPSFSPSVLSYSVTVYSGSITLSPAVEHYSATVTYELNGAANSGSTFTLNPNITNVIRITVKAQDTTISKTYVINVSSRPNQLSGLISSSGLIFPAFSSTTYSYVTYVSHVTGGITFTPTAIYSGAVITINGNAVSSGSTSGSVPLNMGSNIINILVNVDGVSSQNYSIKVYKDYYVTETVAGTGSTVWVDDFGGISLSSASFYNPAGIAVDGNNLYIADSGNNKIRKIDLLNGKVTTLAGTGATIWVNDSGGIAGNAATFSSPYGIVSDGVNLYVADSCNNRIRKIVIATGQVTTLAGTGSSTWVDDSGGIAGNTATFSIPYGIAIDSTGTNLYIADTYNNRIRKIVIATGIVSTLAGKGDQNYVNGSGTAASFYYPGGIAIDSTGTYLYVADTNNNRIRKIVIATGDVTTIAGNGTIGVSDGTGTAATFSFPNGIATDGTNLYIADTYNNKIRKIVISTGVVTSLAGHDFGNSGYSDGISFLAKFFKPYGIVTDGNYLYIADTYNNRIRKIQ